jgi:ADP-heptose:LPS heptosyltransferase
VAKPRFVVLCLQGFGDALEATPFVDQLRRNNSSAEIVLVAMRRQVRDMYEAMPLLVDRVIYVPYWEKGRLAATLCAAGLPAGTKSDASFLAYPAARPEYAVFARAIRSREHYAHDYARPARFAWLERSSSRVVPIAAKHNVLRNLDLLSAAGFPVTIPTGYVVPETWKAARDRPSRVLLHIGSIAHDGLENKRWPAENFLELARELERRSFDLAFISGPAERQETSRLARELGPATEIIEGDLPAIGREVARSGGIVANDSGIAHLAAGVGTPVVALMGPTPVEFGPYGTGALAFRPSSCPPCFDPATTDMRCVLDIDYACLKRDIRVGDVATALVGLMNRHSSPVL